MLIGEFLRNNLRSMVKELVSKIEFQKEGEQNRKYIINELEKNSEFLLGKLAFIAENNLYLVKDGLEIRNFFAEIELIAKKRAEQGFTSNETMQYVLNLKNVVLNSLILSQDSTGDAIPKEYINYMNFIDLVSIKLFEFYAAARERIISQQSKIILELSTPTLKLWDEIILLPLIGILDSVRATELMENLLEAIVKNEAKVVIIDITGVPVIDTKVAHYLLKTLTAAKMLGSEPILTGISPNAAQTLVKIGVDLRSIVSKGTLRGGVAEAFKMVNLRVSKDSE